MKPDLSLSYLSANENNTSVECYLGLLYTMDDVSVYGYITPLKVKIVLVLELADSIVRDKELITVCNVLLSIDSETYYSHPDF